MPFPLLLQYGLATCMRILYVRKKLHMYMVCERGYGQLSGKFANYAVL